MKKCGDCAFAQPAKERDGTVNFQVKECHGFPPTPVFAVGPRGGTPIGIRPLVSIEDPACSLHQAKNVLDLASHKK